MVFSIIFYSGEHAKEFCLMLRLLMRRPKASFFHQALFNSESPVIN